MVPKPQHGHYGTAAQAILQIGGGVRRWFIDADEPLRALSAAGDPLERLRAVLDFEVFRPELESAVARADRSCGGRSLPRDKQDEDA